MGNVRLSRKKELSIIFSLSPLIENLISFQDVDDYYIFLSSRERIEIVLFSLIAREKFSDVFSQEKKKKKRFHISAMADRRRPIRSLTGLNGTRSIG